jgi:hypothetical protein
MQVARSTPSSILLQDGSGTPQTPIVNSRTSDSSPYDPAIGPEFTQSIVKDLGGKVVEHYYGKRAPLVGTVVDIAPTVNDAIHGRLSPGEALGEALSFGGTVLTFFVEKADVYVFVATQLLTPETAVSK